MTAGFKFCSAAVSSATRRKREREDGALRSSSVFDGLLRYHLQPGCAGFTQQRLGSLAGRSRYT